MGLLTAAAQTFAAGSILAGPCKQSRAAAQWPLRPFPAARTPSWAKSPWRDSTSLPKATHSAMEAYYTIFQNTALFSLLGTTYGGNGTTTFGLPGLRGRVPVHNGNSRGPRLSAYSPGLQNGVENGR